MNYSFQDTVNSWSRLPFDNVGYLPADQILKKSPTEIKSFVAEFEENRYSLNGWRNYKNLWRSYLGLDTTEGKHILDFGCGFGIEALQFLKAGNKVTLADINEETLEAATYLLNTMGYTVEKKLLVTENYPFFSTLPDCVDIFYANGVLHHTPKIKEILSRSREILFDAGEVRLMLYTDKAWEWCTEELPNRNISVEQEPKWDTFCSKMDGVKTYSDWYDEEKLEALVEGMYTVRSFDYICGPPRADIYCISTLRH